MNIIGPLRVFGLPAHQLEKRRCEWPVYSNVVLLDHELVEILEAGVRYWLFGNAQRVADITDFEVTELQSVHTPELRAVLTRDNGHPVWCTALVEPYIDMLGGNKRANPCWSDAAYRVRIGIVGSLPVVHYFMGDGTVAFSVTTGAKILTDYRRRKP